MRLNIVFLKSKRGFNNKEKRKIENIIRKTVKHAAKLLKLKNKRIINFTVYPVKRRFTWGTATNKDYVELYVVKKKFNEDDLKGTIYHEIHHIARGFCFLSKKKKTSFLETLFSEGLAVAFEIEQIPERIPIYSKYTTAFIQKWLPKVKREKLFGAEFSEDEWFRGRKRKPYWLGYKMGTYFINQIKKNYPKLTARGLTKESARTLLKLSRLKLKN